MEQYERPGQQNSDEWTLRGHNLREHEVQMGLQELLCRLECCNDFFPGCNVGFDEEGNGG